MFLRFSLGSQLRSISSNLINGQRRNASTGISKTKQLKNMLTSPKLEFIMEAHSGLSARIVQETG